MCADTPLPRTQGFHSVKFNDSLASLICATGVNAKCLVLLSGLLCKPKHLMSHSQKAILFNSCLFFLFFASYGNVQNALGYHGDRGLFSSLVDWIAGNASPSLIEGQSLTAEVCALKASASDIQMKDSVVMAL